MPDFDQLRKVSSRHTSLIRDFVDEFLIYYAATNRRFRKEMEKRFDRFDHILKELPEPSKAMMSGQYRMMGSGFRYHFPI